VKTKKLDEFVLYKTVTNQVKICLGRLATIAPKQRKRPISSPQHLPFLQPTPIPSAMASSMNYTLKIVCKIL
jgi:hypothetical protein